MAVEESNRKRKYPLPVHQLLCLIKAYLPYNATANAVVVAVWATVVPEVYEINGDRLLFCFYYKRHNKRKYKNIYSLFHWLNNEARHLINNNFYLLTDNHHCLNSYILSCRDNYYKCCHKTYA